MLKKLMCWWFGHDYDTSRYGAELIEHHRFNRDLLFKSRAEIEAFYDNPPLPFCDRCNRYI